MARKDYKADAHEAAYRKWRECNQSISLTLKELHKDGWRIARSTLIEWRDKGREDGSDWKSRATRAEVEEHKTMDAQLDIEDRMIATLAAEGEKYKRYFDTVTDLSKVDINRYNQAIFAYRDLTKAISELKKQKREQAPAPEAPAREERREAPEKPALKEASPEDLVVAEGGLVVRILKFSRMDNEENE